MSTKKLFGGSKSRSEQRASIIPRLPPVIPSIGTQAGSFLRATPTFETSGAAVGSIRSPGENPVITNRGAFTGLDIDVGLAPEIGALREETLAGRRGLIGDITGDIETLRGAENPFIRARVQPFVEQQAAAARDAARRGVSGPLAALATNPFTQQIAQQQALATFDTQAAIRQGQEQIRGLLADVSGEGQQLLEQELALLGLSQQQIRDAVASQLDRQVISQTEQKTDQEGGIVSGLGSLAGGVGGVLDFFRPRATAASTAVQRLGGGTL